MESSMANAQEASTGNWIMTANIGGVEQLDLSRNKVMAAAQIGDINLLYEAIRDDPYVLERIDQVPFLDTPLHIAAKAGHAKFTMDVMMLKPSFARKLNPDGFSPIHLALQKMQILDTENISRLQTKLVFEIIDADRDLVRLKGREGMTPLHYAAENGYVELVAEFLELCPKCINDVTSSGQTALHLAVKSNKYEVLQVLVGWLLRLCHSEAQYVRNSIFYRGDERGNTILHLAAYSAQRETVKFLFELKLYANIKNCDGVTVLDILETQKHLYSNELAEIRRGANLKDLPSFETKLRSRLTTWDKICVWYRSGSSEDTSNSVLVVAGLIATSTYQAMLNPPSGLYPKGDDEQRIFTGNVTSVVKKTNPAEKSTTDNYASAVFWLLNGSLLCLSIAMMHTRFQRGVRILVSTILFYFYICYTITVMILNPTPLIISIHISIFIMFLILRKFRKVIWYRKLTTLDQCTERMSLFIEAR